MATKRGDDFRASWVASGDLSGSQYRFVTYAGVDVYLPTSGVVTAGVLQNKPQNNEHASVISQGFSKLILAASVGAGVEVMAANNGFAINVGSGQWVGGRTLTAGDSGAIVEADIYSVQRAA